MKEFLATIWKPVLGVFVGAVLIGFLTTRSLSPKEPLKSSLESATPRVVVKLLPSGPDPKKVAVAVGDLVEFASRDGLLHDLREGEPDAANHAAEPAPGTYHSGVFAPDEAYRVRFDRVGEFVFHDHLHTNIVIQVSVHERTN